MKMKSRKGIKSRGTRVIKLKVLTILFLLLAMTALGSRIADAKSTDLANFISKYGGLPIADCDLCHPGFNTKQSNPYLIAYRDNGRNVAALALIESHDSDGDSFSNIVEINAGTYPGDAASIPVVTANEPPAAYAGPDQDVNAGETVTLDGSGSTDSDGTIVSYSWVQTDGPAAALTGASTARPTFTAPAITTGSATLIFELTVTDDDGASATDFCYINVLQANKAPVADAGPDHTVDEGVTVTLNGLNSSDPDDGIATYHWLQIEGPAVSLSDPAAAQPTFLSPDVGPGGAALTFELTVTDRSGQAATDTCIVNVSWINVAPTADAGPDQAVDAGAAVTLNASNSSDPDDGIQSYAWKQLDGIAVSLTNAATAEAGFTAPSSAAAGATLTFEVTVTDLGGLKSTDTCIVNVGSANAAPSANAGADQTVSAGDSVTLDGSASSDPENAISGYAWRQTDGPAVTLSDPNTSNPAFQAPDAGVDGAALRFELTVTDDGGLQSTDACIVNIAGANRPPVADAGTDQTVTAGTSVTLDGSGSTDPDDGITEYLWAQTEGPAVTLSDAGVMSPSFLAPDAGANGAQLIFELTVTDAGGLQSTATCSVNIAPVEPPPGANQPPIADAGSDLTVNAGDSVTLDGSNSSDPDDGIAAYQWNQVSGPEVTLHNPPPERPTFTAPPVSEGSVALTFQLTVTDFAGQTATDTSVVTVLPAADPPEPGQPSIDGLLARISALLQEPGIPKKARRQLKKVRNRLEQAYQYWQNNQTEQALNIVKSAAENLRSAIKKAKRKPELQSQLKAILDDLKNMVATGLEAAPTDTTGAPDGPSAGEGEKDAESADNDEREDDAEVEHEDDEHDDD